VGFETDVIEITQNEAYYAVQGHSRSPILHRFRDIAFDRSKIAIFCYFSYHRKLYIANKSSAVAETGDR